MPNAATLPRTRNGNPRLKRTSDVIDYWVERIGQVAPEREFFEYSSMICRGDSLFHYGTHFELARILRDRRGRARLVLHNGDSYPGTGGFGPPTSSRQSETRSAVAVVDIPSVTVPFSALAGAGIDFDTIRPIHVRDDRFTIERHSSRKRPADLATMADPSGAMRTETFHGYGPGGYHSDNPDDRDYREREREVRVRVQDPNNTVAFSAQHGWAEGGARRDADGVWHWDVRRHWLGDAIFRARITERRTRKATAEELAAHEARAAWEREHQRLSEAHRQCDPHRHWRPRRYGAAPTEPRNYRQFVRAAFAAQGFSEALSQHYEVEPPASRLGRDGRVSITVTRWATYLSSFDYQESRPLYFLCELPYGAKPNTVDEAIEALKPPEVVAALARGLNVIRQGDLFAIPTKLTKRQIRRMAGGRRANFQKRLRVLGTNHSVTEGIVLKGGAVLGRGVMRHEPEAWRPPDHASQKLGDNWHLLVRNTVPRTR